MHTTFISRFVPVGLADGLQATLVTAVTSHLIGAACGLILVLAMAFTAAGRHILQAIGFALIATPVLIASFLITNAIGASEWVPNALGTLPSFALALLIGASSALVAQDSAGPILRRHSRRPTVLIWSVHAPYVLVGALTALLLSFPATLLYTTIGEMVSGASSPSLGRLLLGTLPSGRIGQLMVLALCQFITGIVIWKAYAASRRVAIKLLRIGDQDIEERGMLAATRTLESVLVPMTAIALVLIALFLGSRLGASQLMIRSPEAALASLGSDYITLREIAGMTASMLGKAFMSVLIAAVIGYVLTITLPRTITPLRHCLLGSALMVQIVPIVVIAAILWLLLPNLPSRDLVVATLSCLYPAYQIMHERQATIPKALSDMMRTHGANQLRSQWFVRGPWAVFALPTVILATVPFAVNALIASDYILRANGLGRWLYVINARGEATMIQGMFIVILVCSLVPTSLLLILKRIIDRKMNAFAAPPAALEGHVDGTKR